MPDKGKHASARKSNTRPAKRTPNSRKPAQQPDKDSPFAALAELRKSLTTERGD